jgi:TM2 domain-containing membrane protein YozV
MTTCPACTAPNAPGTAVCRTCGQPLVAPPSVYAPPAVNPAVAAHLVGLSATQVGRAYPVAPALPLTLGSAPVNDVAIEGEPSVAPQHARLYWTHPYCCVQDLGSPTGTFVNGRRVTGQAVLTHGDLLQLGQVQFRFLDAQAAPGYAASPIYPVAVASPYTLPAPSLPKDRVAAGVLAILLGCFGAHLFYLNKVGWGLAFLLFTLFTCGYGALITAPISLVQGILYLCANEPEFQQKYALERRFF